MDQMKISVNSVDVIVISTPIMTPTNVVVGSKNWTRQELPDSPSPPTLNMEIGKEITRYKSHF